MYLFKSLSWLNAIIMLKKCKIDHLTDIYCDIWLLVVEDEEEVEGVGLLVFVLDDLIVFGVRVVIVELVASVLVKLNDHYIGLSFIFVTSCFTAV